MALNKKIFPKVAVAGNGGAAASAEQNLIVHLDANDVDSYDGDGSIWYDISEHDLTIPLSDNADDLELHLNASDTTSYDPATDTTTWTDISDNSRDATLTSLTNTDHDIDNGGYFELDGSNDSASVSHNAVFNSSTNISFEVWVNRDSTTEDTILSKGTTASNNYFFIYSPSNGYYYYNYVSGGGVKSGTTGLSTGQWEHVVVTRDGSGTPKIYVNGEDKSTTVGSPTSSSTTDTGVLNIGGRNGFTATGHGFFDGKMGAVRIYSKQLSASEIGQNYRHGRDYIYTDLVDDTNLELHLDPTSYSGSGSTWTADTGSNGTLVGNISYDQELGDWFDLDGSSDYITVNSSAINAATNFTIEGWFNPDNLTAADHLFAIYGGASDRKLFLRLNNTSGDLDWQIYNSSGASAGYFTTSNANARLTANQWNHVAVTHINNGSMEVFVDGVSAGTGTSTGINTTGTEDLYIGVLNTFIGSYDFDGKVGQVRFYSSALSSDEVMQNYLFTKNNYPNVYHATAVNSPTFSSSYFDFDDTNSSNTDYFTLSNDVLQVLSGKEGMSVSAWVNFDTVSGFQNIVTTYAGGSVNLFNLLSFNAKFRFYLYGSDFEGSQSSADVFSTGVWTHIVAVFDGTQAHASGTGGRYQAYINGSEITMNTAYTGPNITTVPSAASNVPLRIAAGFGGGSIGEDSFDGKISKIRIYDRAITSAEVTAIYDLGSGN